MLVWNQKLTRKHSVSCISHSLCFSLFFALCSVYFPLSLPLLLSSLDPCLLNLTWSISLTSFSLLFGCGSVFLLVLLLVLLCFLLTLKDSSEQILIDRLSQLLLKVVHIPRWDHSCYLSIL